MTTPIGATDPTAPAAIAGTAASPSNAMNKDTFLKLLVAQLKYQNPMSPTDSTQFLQQTATFTQVENLQDILTKTTDLLAAQQNSQATNMLGDKITATGANGKDITGIVTGMRLTADGPVLKVNGTEVNLGAVTEIDQPDEDTTTKAANS